MALINCEECGKDISDKAITCPHCGAPLDHLKLEQRVLEQQQDEREPVTILSNEEQIAEQEKKEKETSEVLQVLAIIFVVIIAGFIIQGISKATDKRDNPSALEQEESSQQPTPEEILNSQFSYQGEHYELARMVKESMHNPDSYEFVSGEHWTNNNGTFASLKYRGTNGFGGVVTEEVVATLDSSGNVISISR